MAKQKKQSGKIDLKPIAIKVDGKKREFDICDPKLPDWIEDKAMQSGNYPYDRKLKRSRYEERLIALQEELAKLQDWVNQNGERIMIMFEGRDAAGKGGTIAAFRQYLNPRSARNVALSKPTETERKQWYYQRYISHFPAAGEIVTFDRSWYNRGGVEPVMGFCTPEQHLKFLQETPHFERMIVDENIHFFKIWLNIGQEMQLKRFHDRVHSTLKYWKFSPMDIAGIERWKAYSQYRDTMIDRTHSTHAPWTVVRSNDKRRARIEVIAHVLRSLDYDGKNNDVIGSPNINIIANGPDLLDVTL